MLVVNKLAGAERILGRRLDTATTRTLRMGGVLTWEKSWLQSDHTVTLGQMVGLVGSQKETRRIPGVAGRVVPIANQWRRYHGLVLAATARRLGMEIAPVGYVFRASETAVRQAQAALEEAGRSTYLLQGPRPFDPVPAGLGYRASKFGLIALTLLSSFAVFGALASSAGRDVSVLVALGIRPRLARRVFLYQSTVLACIGVAVMIVGAAPAVHALLSAFPGLLLSIPYRELGAVGAGLMASLFASTLLNLRKIRNIRVRS